MCAMLRCPKLLLETPTCEALAITRALCQPSFLILQSYAMYKTTTTNNITFLVSFYQCGLQQACYRMWNFSIHTGIYKFLKLKSHNSPPNRPHQMIFVLCVIMMLSTIPFTFIWCVALENYRPSKYGHIKRKHMTRARTTKWILGNRANLQRRRSLHAWHPSSYHPKPLWLRHQNMDAFALTSPSNTPTHPPLSRRAWALAPMSLHMLDQVNPKRANHY